MSPYRLHKYYDLYAVGEYTALTFLPAIAYALWLLYHGEPGKVERRRAMTVLALSYSTASVPYDYHRTCNYRRSCGSTDFLAQNISPADPAHLAESGWLSVLAESVVPCTVYYSDAFR